MIKFEKVTIVNGRKSSSTEITKDFSVEFGTGEFTCILGPSGCGKTTLLNIIANFQNEMSGNVEIGGSPVAVSTIKLGYVFQGHNIFPWKTIRQNILFGLTSSALDDHEKSKRVNDIAMEVELSSYLDSYPDVLSGGMKQRVGLARALVGDPKIILMDEPFASIDALTAIKLRKLLKRLSKAHSSTVVFVTHNIEEAIDLGDRIIVVSQRPMKILIDKKITPAMSTSAELRSSFKTEIISRLQLDGDT